MPGPIPATGAISNPTRYGALTMGARQMTGMDTQRSPYRDALVPYIVSKNYAGTRFDSIIDGINREITSRLTDKRRSGSVVFNENDFPPTLSFYSWKYIQSTEEIVRTIVDGNDGVIYDATPGQKSTLLAKSAGAGPARFLGVNTELFVCDGVTPKKVLRSSKVWKASTSFNVGNFIIDSNGNIQSIQANPVSYTITNIAVQQLTGIGLTIYILIVSLSSDAPEMPPNQTCSFSGLTTYTTLNGKTIEWNPLPAYVTTQLDLQSDQIAFFAPTPAAYGPAADTGTMVALVDEPGTTGATQPTWGTTWGAVTNDGGTNGGVNWICFGSPVQNWGLPEPTDGHPSYDPPVGRIHAGGTGFRFINYWTDLGLTPGEKVAIIDAVGNVQLATNGTAGNILNGSTLPTWAAKVGAVTKDGQFDWVNYGQIGPWFAGGTYGGGSFGVSNPCVVVDTNGNLQMMDDPMISKVAGSTTPAWATTYGATTTDGAITWSNLGGGSILWSGILQYSMSFHSIDGSVSTAMPVTLIANGGLGPSGGFWMQLTVDLTGTPAQTDKQIDEIWLWRTAQGQSTLILLDIVPNPFLRVGAPGNNNLVYWDVSTDLQLNPFIPAPVAQANNPPPTNITAPIYHLQRIWAIVDNMVVHSGGPDTITGNGNTAFAPLDEIPYMCQPIRLISVTVQGGGILVLTTAGVYIILGTGTPGDPFYTTLYYSTVSIRGYNAVDVYNNEVFLMEANNKVSALAIEYPFNPQGGYTEVGFPIGDQFRKVTTGGISSSLYDSANAFVTWNVQSTGETGFYVADGAVGWFRMGLLMPPESGLAWNPRAAIVGGTSAVQSIETSPGRMQLLIGPATTGPILTRDDTGTVWNDNGTGYPAWDAKGVNLLCSTGQVAEVAHIAAKSAAVGARPVVSVLLGEIAPSTARPYVNLKLGQKSNDPALTRPSLSVYSDRYVLAQNGVDYTSDCILTKFDYGTQTEPDELLDWAIYASVHDEREQQAEKV